MTDVNGLSEHFGRPLPLAAAWGRLHIVRHLLHDGADPHLLSVRESPKDWDRDFDVELVRRFTYKIPTSSALLAAVFGGHEDIVRLLLEPKYRISLDGSEYLRAILAGAQSGHLHLIELLLRTMGKNVSDLPNLGESMLWAAVRHDRANVVQMLLRSGVDINCYPWPNVPASRGTLSSASAQGNIHMVRFLVDQGANVNYSINFRSEQSIDCAARCGQEEVISFLLDQGADPVRALRCAAEAGQARVVKFLLARDAELIDQDGAEAGYTALRKAITSKNPAVISLLLDAGVALNGYADPYDHPIFLAKATAAPWIVDFLISLGAQDYDFEGFPDDSTKFLEEDIGRQQLVGGVYVSKRTWEWVGKY